MEFTQSYQSGTESESSDETVVLNASNESRVLYIEDKTSSPKSKRRKYSPRKRKSRKYSSCHVCPCKGYKDSISVTSVPSASSSKILCSDCQHSMSDHGSRSCDDLESSSIDKMIMHLKLAIAKEEDVETKSVHSTVLNMLTKRQQDGKKVDFTIVYGSPPFEKPCISQAVMNFVHMYIKNESKLPALKILGQKIIENINCTRMCKVKTFMNKHPEADIAAYKMTFARWLSFCHIPALCKSLPCYKVSDIFGLSLLRILFPSFKHSILDNYNSYSHKHLSHPKAKEVVLQSLTRFMSKLEEELKNDNSNMWDIDMDLDNCDPEKGQVEIEKKIIDDAIMKCLLTTNELLTSSIKDEEGKGQFEIKKKIKDDAIMKCLLTTNELLTSSIKDDEGRDEDYHFLKMLGVYLKGIPSERKMDLHIKILQMVRDEKNKS